MKKILGQVIIAALISVGFYQMINKSASYTWVFEKVLKANYDFIQEHKELTFDQKMQVKHGFKYNLCQYINKNTPEDAIILIPYPDAIKEAKELDNKKSVSASLKNKAFANYFIYPRTFLYPTDKESNPLWNKITHVLIVDYKGYDYVNYAVKKKNKYQVLPINK